MKFTNNESLYIAPENKYNLSRVNVRDLTLDDFTILIRFKPCWDLMIPGELSAEGGLVAKNGMHCGMTVRHEYINGVGVYVGKCLFFTEDEEGTVFPNIIINELSGDMDWYEFSMVHNLENKSMTFTTGNQKKEVVYNGNIVDYSNSWLWIGACCGFDFFDLNHRHYFNGEINYLGVFQSSLNDEIIRYYFDNTDDINYNKLDKVISISNFKTSTPYKIKDDSGNGNNLILYKNGWF
jgi:hypothetical protein